MRNYDAWQLYMRDVPAASLYLEWGFYWMVSACLQRRVWVSGQESSAYPNLYVVFTGTPATGKSQVSMPIKNILRESTFFRERKTKEGKVLDMTELPRFPMAADSTGFESLVEQMATHVSQHQLSNEIYHHHSLTFVLDELASIFKIHADDVCKFLLTAYGCGPYRREIRNKQGCFTIDRTCLSLLAGTTIDDMRWMTNKRLLSSGMSSRTIFVYARGPRFRKPLIPSRDEEQLKAREHLAEYVKKLHKCYGPVTYSKEAHELLFKKLSHEETYVTNKDPILKDYFDRKALHCHKLCMAILFAEQVESYTITVDILERALALLETTEVDMHIPLSGGHRNEQHTVGVDIVSFLRDNPGASYLEILSRFISQARAEEIDTILTDLIRLKELEVSTSQNGQATYKVNGQPYRFGLSNQGGKVNSIGPVVPAERPVDTSVDLLPSKGSSEPDSGSADHGRIQRRRLR